MIGAISPEMLEREITARRGSGIHSQLACSVMFSRGLLEDGGPRAAD